MKESYRRRSSEPSWPRPCEGGATQRPHLKRWTGEHVGWVSLKLMSSEKTKIRGADGVRLTGRQHCDVRYLACASQARRSRRPQACMETSRARTEIPCGHPPVVEGGSVGEGDEL